MLCTLHSCQLLCYCQDLMKCVSRYAFACFRQRVLAAVFLVLFVTVLLFTCHVDMYTTTRVLCHVRAYVITVRCQKKLPLYPFLLYEDKDLSTIEQFGTVQSLLPAIFNCQLYIYVTLSTLIVTGAMAFPFCDPNKFCIRTPTLFCPLVLPEVRRQSLH